MHTRRLATFLLGGWLIGSLFMAFVATQSLAGADRALRSQHPQVSKIMGSIGGDTTRQLLRFQSGRLNRHLFAGWEAAQLGIAGALLTVAVFSPRRSKTLLAGGGAMTLIVVVMAFYLTPTMKEMAPAFEFLPPGTVTPERESFGRLHGAYMACEAFKLLIGLVVSARLIFDRAEWKNWRIAKHQQNSETAGVYSKSSKTSGNPGSTPLRAFTP
ncbi:MAG: hypothetical protein ACRD7E_30285 [Bryobacteraceae bacterium]